MKVMKTLRVLQAIANTCNGENLLEVLTAQVEHVREALPAATTRLAVQWMLTQPWQTQQEFFPAGYEECLPHLKAIEEGPKVRGLTAMLAARKAVPASSSCTVYKRTAASRPDMVCSLGTRGCGGYHGR